MPLPAVASASDWACRRLELPMSTSADGCLRSGCISRWLQLPTIESDGGCFCRWLHLPVPASPSGCNLRWSDLRRVQLPPMPKSAGGCFSGGCNSQWWDLPAADLPMGACASGCIASLGDCISLCLHLPVARLPIAAVTGGCIARWLHLPVVASSGGCTFP